MKEWGKSKTKKKANHNYRIKITFVESDENGDIVSFEELLNNHEFKEVVKKIIFNIN